MSKTKQYSKLPRNGAIVDRWSMVHILSAMSLTVVFGPEISFIVTLLWEPIEIFVISPIAAEKFGVLFGHETFANSFSDVIFNCIGILGALLIFG